MVRDGTPPSARPHQLRVRLHRATLSPMFGETYPHCEKHYPSYQERYQSLRPTLGICQHNNVSRKHAGVSAEKWSSSKRDRKGTCANPHSTRLPFATRFPNNPCHENPRRSEENKKRQRNNSN